LKENGIMNDKPRKSNESLFGDGGLELTIVYGIIISLLTLLSFISVPVSELNSLSMNINFSNIKEQLITNEYVLAKAQTFAFSTLAVGELIHALGMRDTKESFVRKNIFKNKLMNVSLLLGLLLQVSVVTFPFFNKTFKTVCLSVYEWSFIFGMVFLILITHEIIVLIKRAKKSKIDCVHEK
jgi:Ca2+-transporting ATPase